MSNLNINTPKIAIVGIGVIGNVHLSVLMQQERTVSAICDIDAARMNAAKEKFGISPECYTDFIAMLDTAKPNVVHICTPHYLHASMIVECLKRDINVLCEKPMCIKENEIAEIIEAEKCSKAILGICQQNRYNPTNLYAKDFLRDKEIASAHGEVLWNRNRAYYENGMWRAKWDTAGGGALINQALHTLDLTQWFTKMPDSLSASISNVSHSDISEVEDTAFIKADGDIPFTFFTTISSITDYPVKVTVKLKDKRTLTVTNAEVCIDNDVAFSAKSDKFYGKACYGSGHTALIHDYYECVENGRHFEIDGAEGAKVIKLILATYKSESKVIKI